MKFYSYLLILTLLSCNQTTNKENIQIISKDSTQLIHRNTQKIDRIRLNSNSKKELKNWKEYQLVDEILSKFNTISNEEALSNAKELSDLASQLIDSIPDKRLKSAPIKSRLRIFINECLRLKDMADIPAISPEEVSQKINDVLMGFSMLNAKLNAVYKVRNMENELELDPDFESILNDSIQVDIIIEDNEGASEIMERARVKRIISPNKKNFPLNDKHKKKIKK